MVAKVTIMGEVVGATTTKDEHVVMDLEWIDPNPQIPITLATAGGFMEPGVIKGN
jgi:ATP-dependent protease ClpP protease subunit